MKQEINKVSKIVSELINFCLNNSAKKIEISIEDKEDRFEILIGTDYIECSKDDVENVKTLLETGRQLEVDEYYWQLTGEDMSDQELSLVGMMVDEAIVNWEKPSMKIKLIRYRET
jgi:hypothetical protein